MSKQCFSPETPDLLTRLFRGTLLAATLVAAALSISEVLAQNPADEPDEREQTARLRMAEVHVGKIEMRLVAGGREVVPRIERPLLLYGDSARDNADGTLWAWGTKGRPLALLETYESTKGGGGRANAITLTGTQLIIAKAPTTSATVWQPQQTQIEPIAFPDAPAPSDRETIRLRQMKDLARRMSAHEFWDPDNSRFELRLLVQPVHRYADPESKIHDGAMFVLAHGTNPEVIVLLEALGESLAASRWHYSLARLGSAELRLAIDDREVWRRDRTPGIVGRPTDPYWLFMTPSTTRLISE